MQPEIPYLRCEYKKGINRGIYSKKKFKKGQVICTEVPTAVLQKDVASTKLDPVSCSNCNKVCNTDGMQSFCKCNLNPKCNALFCSKACFNFALKGTEGTSSDIGWHNFTCVEALGSLRTEQYFIEQDACQLAAIILAKSITKVSDSKIDIDREMTILSSVYATDVLEIRSSDQFETEDEIDHFILYQNGIRMLHTRAIEFLFLLKESWLSKLGEYSIAIQKLLAKEFFLKLVTGIQIYARAIEVEPSVKVAGMPAANFRLAVNESIKLSYKDSYSKRGIMKEAKGFCPVLESIEHVNTPFFCGPLVSLLSHSCCPSVQLETSAQSMLGLRVKLVAIQNILPGDELTVSYIPTQQDIHLRKNQLLDRYGFICKCCKCSWENGGIEFSREEIVSMSHLAFDEYRFKDSLSLVKFGAKRWGRDGELFHIMGMIQLALGKWSKAHDTWHAEHFENGVFRFLKTQKEKDKAYVTSFSRGNSILRHNLKPSVSKRCITLAAGAIWLLPSQNLSKKSCEHWISLAEKFASSQGGWCTNRHISIATTDIPIHHIPDLVCEWNLFVTSYLIPLAKQLLTASVLNKQICVHDAFIVKYDASKGRDHLPVHRDQSEISITLALNSNAEFGGGGGTMFPNLGITVCPEIGEALLFRGDLEHGGFPINSGVRYIVAAFFYLEKEKGSCKK